MASDDVIERLARAFEEWSEVAPPQHKTHREQAEFFYPFLQFVGLSLYPTDTHVAVPRGELERWAKQAEGADMDWLAAEMRKNGARKGTRKAAGKRSGAG